jgi:thiol peroxidase
LAGVTARVIFVVGKDGKITYKQVVPEITTEPDYEEAIAAAKAAL